MAPPETDHPATTKRRFLSALGPGLLFAGAAVGVSHLVQSTRAGAVEGLGLLLVVLLANAIKYPAFAAGPWYAAATGHSLLQGYRRQGRLALVLYGVLTLGTMFTVQAAVSLVTAGLAAYLFQLSVEPVPLAIGIMVGCAAILGIGRFPLLDRIVRVAVGVLTVSTLAATVLAIPQIDASAIRWMPASFDLATLAFVAALVGWMPSAIDISVWHSLWTLAKRRATGYRPSVRDARLDFDIGYFGTSLLAVCFLLLGAAVLFGSGVTPADSAGGFAAQIIALYTGMLGDWSYWLIGLAALSVMVSTTITVTDGFPRALGVLLARFQCDEEEGARPCSPVSYWGSLAIVVGGAAVVLQLYVSSLKALVDLATTLSFVTAPFLAALNHRALFSPEVQAAGAASPAFRRYSLACIGVMALLTCGYLWIRFIA